MDPRHFLFNAQVERYRMMLYLTVLAMTNSFNTGEWWTV
jgi:hypothetical protein